MTAIESQPFYLYLNDMTYICLNRTIKWGQAYILPEKATTNIPFFTIFLDLGRLGKGSQHIFR